MLVGIPSLSSTPVAQPSARESYIWEVVAMVYSASARPVRK